MAEPLNPYHLQRDAVVAVVADGPEMFCYSGADDQPTWKVFCNNILVGVGATRELVVAGDVDGMVVWYRVLDGQVMQNMDLQTAINVFAHAPDGTVAMAGPVGIYILDPKLAPRSIGFPDAGVVGFGPDGNSIGVGVGSEFHAVDAADGTVWNTQNLGAEVTGVAWSALGNWVVTAGHKLFVVAGDGSEIVAEVAAEGPLRGAVTSMDGVIGAAVQGLNQVAVFELQTNTSVGDITFRRGIGQL
jgi:hypothetical protein